MSTQHTPGPWLAVKSQFHRGNPASLRLDIQSHGAVFSPAFVAGDILPGDAKLITAAPVMLAALRAITALLEGTQPKDIPGALMVAQAAIKQATA